MMKVELPLARLTEAAGLSPRERLGRLVTLERQDIGSVAVFAGVTSVLSLAVPIAVQALVNTVALTALTQPIVVLTSLVFLGLTISGFFSFMQARVLERLQQRIFARIACDMASRFVLAEPDDEWCRSPRARSNRFFETMTIQKSLVILLVEGFSLALTASVGLVLLAFYHPLLLAFDALLIATIVTIIWPLGRGGVDTAVGESKAKYAVANWLEEVSKPTFALRTSESRAWALGRTEELVRGYVSYRQKHFRVLARQLVTSHGLHAIASALLLGTGAWLVERGQLTLGQLVASELILSSVLYGVTKLHKQLEAYYDLVASLEKVGHVVDIAIDETDDEPSVPKHGPLSASLKNCSVTSARDGNSKRSLTFAIGPGERIALVGEIGSGKSTALELLCGYRQPTTGITTIEGVSVRHSNRGTLRGRSLLLRRGEVFEGTVAENLRLGRDVSLNAMELALSAVDLLEKIRALPEGLKTFLSAKDPPFSEGELRRLLLARAELLKPGLICVDDLFEGLGSDPIVDRLLFGTERPWTVVFATHDPSIIARCDRSIAIEHREGVA